MQELKVKKKHNKKKYQIGKHNNIKTNQLE